MLRHEHRTACSLGMRHERRHNPRSRADRGYSSARPRAGWRDAAPRCPRTLTLTARELEDVTTKRRGVRLVERLATGADVPFRPTGALSAKATSPVVSTLKNRVRDSGRANRPPGYLPGGKGAHLIALEQDTTRFSPRKKRQPIRQTQQRRLAAPDRPQSTTTSSGATENDTSSTPAGPDGTGPAWPFDMAAAGIRYEKEACSKES